MDVKDTPNLTLHQKILGDIERKIVSGEWPPGHRLPFEVDLAKSYDVSRMTVNKVMTQLARAGLIERRKRSGSFVSLPRVQAAILEISDIEAEVRSLGQPYSYTILTSAVRRMEEMDVADCDIPDDADVLDVTCVHYAGQLPFCLEERLINLVVVPEARAGSFETSPPGAWLLKQTPWSAAEHRIFAVNALGSLPKLLGIAKNAACLVVQRRTWSELGPVTHVRLTYPGEHHSILARFAPAASSPERATP